MPEICDISRSSAADRDPSARARWLWMLLLAMAVLAAYAPAFRADFIWDDPEYVTENPAIVGDA